MQNKRRRFIWCRSAALILGNCHIVFVGIQAELIIAAVSGLINRRVAVTIHSNFGCNTSICIYFVHFHGNSFQLLLGFLHDTITFDCTIVVRFIDPCPAAVGIASGDTQHIGCHGGIVCLMLGRIFFYCIYMNGRSLYHQLSGRGFDIGNLVGNCRVVLACINAVVDNHAVTIHLQRCIGLTQLPCGNRVLIVPLRQCIPQQIIPRCQI